jgi:hypothetical protein
LREQLLGTSHRIQEPKKINKKMELELIAPGIPMDDPLFEFTSSNFPNWVGCFILVLYTGVVFFGRRGVFMSMHYKT